MKQKILLFFLLALGIVTMGQKDVKINPNVGLTFSQLTNGGETNVKASYVAGLDLRFGDVVNFVPGLYFGNVGTDINYTDTSVKYQYDNSINTLQLRLQIAVNAINRERLKARLIAGPSLHWTVQSLDIEKDNIENFITYFNAGVGVDIGFFTLDLKYEYGLTDVFNENGTNTITVDTKNNILIFSVGLVF